MEQTFQSLNNNDSEEAYRIVKVWFWEDRLFFDFADGRTGGCPLKWFPSFKNASPEQLQNWRLIGSGEGVHWPDLDEDISGEGMWFFRPPRR